MPYSPGPISPALPRPSSSSSLRAPKISGTRLSPNSSVEDLRVTQQRPLTNGTTFTGSNSLYGGASGANSHSPAAHSPLAQTIGTPYQETSASFPLPQHVATRPKTAGATSTVAGVSVPTHHTSTPKPDGSNTANAPKSERRKTRLLNPIAFLSRRKSGQDVDVTDAERSAAAQAYARQRSVAAGGVNRLPEDFDPRIKGKVVHDFSAPRKPPRNFSYHESGQRPPEQPLQTANSAPSVPLLFTDPHLDPPLGDGTHVRDSSSSNRKSVHSAMFHEMLTENPDATKRGSSLNAERLENRDFLQRVSHHSSASNFSQESAVLPPFARRSQVLDATQASFYNDEESKRSSNHSTHKDRDSNSSSFSQISPVTARSSNPVTDLRSSLGLSLSPVSPASTNKGVSSRPISIISDLPPPSREAPALPDLRGRATSEATARPSSDGGMQVSAEQSSIARERSPYRNSALAPEVVIMPERQSSLFAPSEPWDGIGTPPAGTSIFDKTSSLATPTGTPEIAQAETVSAAKVPQSPPKLVEKRVSAVGHAKRTSLSPKHHVSNASRFSFQFESTIEERALEEKHRQIRAQCGDGVRRGSSPNDDDDDDDEFDARAMDDMDELEVQQQQQQQQQPEGATTPSTLGLLGLQQARKQLQLAESDGSDYEGDGDVMADEREVTYALHPAFRTHSALAGHSRTGSHGTYAGWSIIDGTSPKRSNHDNDRRYSDQSVLTVDTTLAVQANRQAFGQDHFTANHPSAPRSGFYMQPQAAGYSPMTESRQYKASSAITENASPNRNRAGSRMSFASVDSKQRRRLSGLALTSDHQRLLSQSSVGESTISEARATPSGLGSSGFGDFNFSDSPEGMNGSRPISFALGQGNENRRTRDSETIPLQAGWGDGTRHAFAGTSPSETDTRKSSIFSSAPPNRSSAVYRGNIGQNIHARTSRSTAERWDVPGRLEDDQPDDMYFDDGGFEQDICRPLPPDVDSARMNEDDFDDESFLGGTRRPLGRKTHERDLSAVSMGSDGPYPSFAMGANPLPARQRQSQMLLEDLPLLEGPVDPKLIPQRNPSEDAKRLGLSKKVPPLPPPPGSHEATLRQMQANLHAYHAALAEAVNQAAAEGRFSRQSSVASTTQTLSARSLGPGGEGEDKSPDDRSHYSRDEAGNALNGGSLTVPGNGEGVHRSISETTTGSRMEQGQAYSPLKMLDFDFGFNNSGTPSAPLSSSPRDLAIFSDDDFGTTDDDIVAAANAEVLASEDGAFYGHEFGFYAHARPQAAGATGAVATNGGFFGEDGDDGLARTRSLKEPDLTPITERSEFSTRNSFVNIGPHVTATTVGYVAGAGPPGAGANGGGAGRLVPVSPLVEMHQHHDGAVMASSFDQLRKLRANAFGGSNGSLRSEFSQPSATFGRSSVGGSPLMYGADHTAVLGIEGHEIGSISPSSSSATAAALFHSDTGMVDQDVTPKKPVPTATDTSRKIQTHSRQGSGGGEVTTSYVQEPDPAGSNFPPRWVLERRRTSEQGKLELVEREVVPGDWI
ncbi:MAG: hypothetical protein FE78DRAFT_66641 [Acidomyces sp. 'richmondensis']|nr:MAG: hypothetical protein FE78DRAFT_66641 [Acidomyces sp. 'richmondensis']